MASKISSSRSEHITCPSDGSTLKCRKFPKVDGLPDVCRDEYGSVYAPGSQSGHLTVNTRNSCHLEEYSNRLITIFSNEVIRFLLTMKTVKHPPTPVWLFPSLKQRFPFITFEFLSAQVLLPIYWTLPQSMKFRHRTSSESWEEITILAFLSRIGMECFKRLRYDVAIKIKIWN